MLEAFPCAIKDTELYLRALGCPVLQSLKLWLVYLVGKAGVSRDNFSLT